mgnify:CR=1 FL=1
MSSLASALFFNANYSRYVVTHRKTKPLTQPEFTLSKEDLHETFKKCSHDDKRAKPWSLSTSTDYDLVLQTLMEGLHTDLQNGLSLHDDLHHRAKVYCEPPTHPPNLISAYQIRRERVTCRFLWMFSSGLSCNSHSRRNSIQHPFHQRSCWGSSSAC